MKQSEKTLEFLQKLKDKGHWNDDHDYSLVNYIDRNTKVKIVNKLNGLVHLVKPRQYRANGNLTIQNAEDKTKYAVFLYNLYVFFSLRYFSITIPFISLF